MVYVIYTYYFSFKIIKILYFENRKIYYAYN